MKEGEVLIRFDEDGYKKALADKKRSLKIQKLNLVKLREHYEINMKKMALEVEKIKLNEKLTASQLEMYKKKGHEKDVLLAKQEVVEAERSLEYYVEELKQLEKMYTQDKITEETEEIILKRQRNYVQRKKLELKIAKLALEEAEACLLYTSDAADE